MDRLEIIKKRDVLLAIIIRNNYECNGVDFITPEEYSQQLAYMHHPAGRTIVKRVWWWYEKKRY